MKYKIVALLEVKILNKFVIWTRCVRKVCDANKNYTISTGWLLPIKLTRHEIRFVVEMEEDHKQLPILYK